MKSRMMKIAAALAATAGVAGTALASDSKSYPASSCTAYQGSFFLATSTIWNGSSGFTGVDCPAVKDGSSIASGRIRVRDRSAISGVECTMLSAFVSGSSVLAWTAGPVSSAGSSLTWQNLDFGGLPADPQGYYFFSCMIPPVDAGESAVGPYFIVEND